MYEQALPITAQLPAHRLYVALVAQELKKQSGPASRARLQRAKQAALERYERVSPNSRSWMPKGFLDIAVHRALGEVPSDESADAYLGAIQKLPLGAAGQTKAFREQLAHETEFVRTYESSAQLIAEMRRLRGDWGSPKWLDHQQARLDAVVRSLQFAGVPEAHAKLARFYHGVSKAAHMNNVVHDVGYYRSGMRHTYNFATHDIRHIDNLISDHELYFARFWEHGWLKPRSKTRQKFVEAKFLLDCVLHDGGQGLDNASLTARDEHREFASQIVFSKRYREEVLPEICDSFVGRHVRRCLEPTMGDRWVDALQTILAGAFFHDAGWLGDGTGYAPERTASKDAIREALIKATSKKLTAPHDMGPIDVKLNFEWMEHPELFEDFVASSCQALPAIDVFRMSGQLVFDSSGAPFTIHHRKGVPVVFKHVDDRKGRRVYPAQLQEGDLYALGEAAIQYRRPNRRGELEIGLAHHTYGYQGDHNEKIADAAGFISAGIVEDSLLRLEKRGADIPIVIRDAPGGDGVYAEMVAENLRERLKSFPYKYRIEARKAHAQNERFIASRRAVQKERYTRDRWDGRKSRPLTIDELKRLIVKMDQRGASHQAMRLSWAQPSEGNSPMFLRHARLVELDYLEDLVQTGEANDYLFILERGRARVMRPNAPVEKYSSGALLNLRDICEDSPYGSAARIQVMGEIKDGQYRPPKVVMIPKNVALDLVADLHYTQEEFMSAAYSHDNIFDLKKVAEQIAEDPQSLRDLVEHLPAHARHALAQQARVNGASKDAS